MIYAELAEVEAALQKQKKINLQLDQRLQKELTRKNVIEELRREEISSQEISQSQKSSMSGSQLSAVSYDSEFIKSELQRARAFLRNKKNDTVKFEQNIDLNTFHEKWNCKQQHSKRIFKQTEAQQIQLKFLEQKDLLQTIKVPFNKPTYLLDKESIVSEVNKKQKEKQLREKEQREQIRRELMQEVKQKQIGRKRINSSYSATSELIKLHIPHSEVLETQRIRKMSSLLKTIRKQQYKGDQLLRTLKNK